MGPSKEQIQLFIFHVGERIDYISAPAGSGKTSIVKAWLDSAGDWVDQIWLAEHTLDALDALPRSPKCPTFAVLDDYQPDPLTDRAILDLVDTADRNLNAVIVTDAPPPPSFRACIADGTVRLTTQRELESGMRP